MSRRQQVRRMRADACDPWQHNHGARLVKTMRRLGRAARRTARDMRRMGIAAESVGVAFRDMRDRAYEREIEALIEREHA